jgi:hypothetical protein
MRSVCILVLTAAASGIALADFSYTTTTKLPSGIKAAAGGEHTSKTYLKGQKMMMDSGSSATILDFEAQTITHVDNSRKTYSVSKFGDMGQALQKSGAAIAIDVKETGQRKTINGYNASEVVLTADVAMASTGAAGMKMHMEIHNWISPDVPGSQEMRAFYQKNGDRFPWTAMAGSGRGDQSLQQAMLDIRRKMSAMKGVTVLQVMKMGVGGNDAQTAQMQQGMVAARERLEEMKRQGKLPPQLEQQLAKMQAASGGGSLNETTIESTGFSSTPIPDSVFAVPAGYQQSAQR